MVGKLFAWFSSCLAYLSNSTRTTTLEARKCNSGLTVASLEECLLGNPLRISRHFEESVVRLLDSFGQRIVGRQLGNDVLRDRLEQVQDQLKKLDVSFPMYHGLTIEQMEGLGLYISHPRSPQETDHPFPEPGLIVVNGEGKVHVVDLSNNPFSRPDLEVLVSGLEWIRKPDNNYPIRGTWSPEAQAA